MPKSIASFLFALQGKYRSDITQIVRKISLFVAFIFALTSLGAWVYFRSTSTQSKSRQQAMNSVGPAEGTRALARTINPKQVKFLTFSGPAMGCYDEDCLHTSDKKVINGFLGALNNAVERNGIGVGLGNKDCSLTFHLLAPNSIAKSKEITFSFSSYDPLSHFGPQFERAMKILGEQQAQETRSTTRRLAGQVKTITIGLTKISSPDEIERIISELQKVDARAFSYMVKDSDADSIFTLHMKDNTSKELLFAIPPSTQSNPPLPPLLWSYYQGKHIKS